jgi:hypothetical protein
MTQVRAGPGLVPRLRRSDHTRVQPGFGGRPSGPRIHGDFAVFIYFSLATGNPVAPDDKGERGSFHQD